MIAAAATVVALFTGAHPPILPMHQARTRARIAAHQITRIGPLKTTSSVRFCVRPGASRRTVDCVARFDILNGQPCYLVIRVRYAGSHTHRTVASYPYNPICGT